MGRTLVRGDIIFVGFSETILENDDFYQNLRSGQQDVFRATKIDFCCDTPLMIHVSAGPSFVNMRTIETRIFHII